MVARRDQSKKNIIFFLLISYDLCTYIVFPEEEILHVFNVPSRHFTIDEVDKKK